MGNINSAIEQSSLPDPNPTFDTGLPIVNESNEDAKKVRYTSVVRVNVLQVATCKFTHCDVTTELIQGRQGSQQISTLTTTNNGFCFCQIFLTCLVLSFNVSLRTMSLRNCLTDDQACLRMRKCVIKI